MPVAPVVAAGTVAVAEVEVDIGTGPAHKYPVTLAAPFAFRVKVFPGPIGPLLLALVSDGAGFTVTFVVAELGHPVTPLTLSDTL